MYVSEILDNIFKIRSMTSTYFQRFMGKDKENKIKYPFKGQVRFLQVILDYEGTDSPLTCSVDGDLLREIAIKNGVKDIVSLYDNGSTDLVPSKANVIKEFTEMAARCQPGDYLVFQYSGHGTHTEDLDGDESDGEDQAMCLQNQNGENELLIDDEIAELVSQNLHPMIPCLFLVDACHSGTILDLTNPDHWAKGRRIFCISGCQDDQTSGDTGNGGIMTHALIDTLSHKNCKKRRKTRDASIQFVFNRMVEKMPEEELEMEQLMEEEDFEYEGDYDEAFDEMEFEEDAEEWLEEGEGENEPAPGQCLNLSWCYGTDPCLVSFPF